ncbi:MAG: hypothetical protein U0Q03_23770 [Acidimicrobiales bacterium]
MLSLEQLERVDRAAIGVLGHLTGSSRPNALAVTPYVVDGRLLVTSTLALVDKAEALRRDPRVTLTAGGIAVSGTASVEVDTTPAFFDRYVRRRELAKYPPARSLLSIPGHRRLLPWYVGRVAMWIEPEVVVEQHIDDDTTITVVDAAGRLGTTSIARPHDLDADRLDAAGAPDGRAVLLVHAEDPAMRQLRQLRRHGQVVDGVLHVERRTGSLAPRATGTLDELRSLRTLAAAARANRARLATWPAITHPRPAV